MTDNTTLDAAIEAADHKVKELYDQKQKRRHARALIAKLIEGMEPPIMHDRIHPGIKHGFDFAITEIRRRAGLEVES
jgi:hypothetical protein